MKELEDALRKLAKQEPSNFTATVVKVDKVNGTCQVKDQELLYTDVRLSAYINGKNERFYLFPKIGSSVIVEMIEGDIKNLFVTKYSELESLDVHIGVCQLQMDTNGFLLKKQNETLKALMEDLLEEIIKLKFTTNTGPTIKLINKPAFVAIKNRFNQFLKSS